MAKSDRLCRSIAEISTEARTPELASASVLSFLRRTIRPVRVPPEKIRRQPGHDSSGPFLKITYRYADAGNWKFWGEFHVRGEMSLNDLQPYLFEGEFFIPERIGLRSLVPEMKNEDDHLLHTFEELAAAEPSPYECTANELVERVRLADEEGWFAGIF
jgi:hypothetical protein